MAEPSNAASAVVSDEIEIHSAFAACHPLDTGNSLKAHHAEPTFSSLEWGHLRPNVDVSDADLLLCLLSADGRRDVAQVAAARLLHHFGTFAHVISAPPSDLAHFGGLGQAQILALKATHIAALRVIRTEIDSRPLLSDKKRVKDYLFACVAHQQREAFHVLFLDSGNRLVADETIATGTVNWVSVTTRQVVERALKWQATGLILSHNHPSGDPNPSVADILNTERMAEALAFVDVLVHDHLILSRTDVFSFRETGLLRRTTEGRRSTASRW